MLGVYCKGTPVTFYSVSTNPTHHLVPKACGVGLYFEDVHPEWSMCCSDLSESVKEELETTGRFKNGRLYKREEDQLTFDCLILTPNDLDNLMMYVEEKKRTSLAEPSANSPCLLLIQLMISFIKKHPNEHLFPFFGERPLPGADVEATLNGSLWRSMGNIAIAIP